MIGHLVAIQNYDGHPPKKSYLQPDFEIIMTALSLAVTIWALGISL